VPPFPPFYDDIEGGEQRVRFAYDLLDIGSDYGVWSRDLSVIDDSVFGTPEGWKGIPPDPSFTFSTTTGVPGFLEAIIWPYLPPTVPEIDGGALSQAAFVLLAFGMFLAARRRSGNMA
jgi:hypothetical protein